MTTYLTHVISPDEHKRLAGDRASLRRGALGMDEIALLDAVSPGWSLSELDHQWNRSAISAADFYEREERRANMKSKDSGEAKMGLWLSTQRNRLKKGVLRADRRAWLDEHYPTWSKSLDGLWDQNARDAADFYEREGRHPSTISKNSDEAKMGQWLSNQRQNLKSATLRADRRTWLDEHYPTWSKSLDGLWDQNARDAADFYEREGRHPSVESKNSDEAKMGQWLSKQRAALKDGTLRPDRRAWLDEHYPTWSKSLDDLWDQNARSAVDLYERDGRRPSMESKKPEEAKVGRWLSKQRAALKDGTLRPDRRAWLDEHYPTWDENFDDLWDQKARAAADFYGHIAKHPSKESKSPVEKKLGMWLSNQRAALKDGTLQPDRRAWLDEHYPTWNESLDDLWDQSARDTVDFHSREGRHPNMRSKNPVEKKLGQWLSKQRTTLRRGTLRPDRRAWLDEHYPDWNESLDVLWDRSARAATGFYEREGRHPNRESQNPEEKKLGQWLGNQRKTHKSNALRPDRRAWLDEHYPAWSESLDDLWDQNARSAVDLYERDGRRPSMKSKKPEEAKVGRWLGTQRAALKDGTLRPDRRAWLDEHYPKWDENFDDFWDQKARAASDFYGREVRHPSGGSKNPEEAKLGQWLGTQRAALKDGTLQPDRRAWLDEHYPEWRGERGIS